MRLSCTICYELFIPTDDVHAAPCGHILHYRCWTGWLQRSENCPDCRKPTRLPQLFKLFFNIGEGDDYTTLSNRYDALRCDLSCKTKECEKAEKKLKLQSEENIKLQKELQKFKTENEDLKKSSGSSAEGRKYASKVNGDILNGLLLWQSKATDAIRKKRELAEEITKLKKKAQELEKKKKTAVDNSKKYTEAEVATMRSCENIVQNLKRGLEEYEEMKKNAEFLKSLKVYTDQIDSTTDLWDDVDNEPAKYVELFKDVKRFLEQKGKREEELSTCPRGCVLQLSDFPKGNNVSWQDIRCAVERLGVEVAFVTFNPGDEVAYVRLDEEFPGDAPAHMVADRLRGMKLMICGIRTTPKSLRGEEETNFLRRSLEARDQRNRERFMRRKGYEDVNDQDCETFLDFCMQMVAEAKTEEKVVARCLTAIVL